jgi:endonuclease/exonuclease/phosphatase (EEP) superfamily protein YafD
VINALREVGDRIAEFAKLTDQDTVLRAQLAAEADALRHASNRCQAGFTAHIEQVSLIQTGAEHLTALVRRQARRSSLAQPAWLLGEVRHTAWANGAFTTQGLSEVSQGMRVAREVSLWALRVLAGIMIAGSLASATRFEQWWIRIWDFPRLQIFIVLAVLAVLVAAFDRKTRPMLPLVLAICAGWQAYRIFPHSFLAPTEVASADARTTSASCIRAFAFNVLQDNRDYAAALDLIRSEKPDILLLTETDAAWAEALDPVLRDYPHRLGRPLSNTYGMMFASRFPLSDGSIQDLAMPDTPSVMATLKVDEQDVRFFGIHPHPPRLGSDTDERDYELLKVGKLLENDQRPVLVLGDFNDVAWSNTSELFKSTARLLDPRIGRGSYATFPSNMIWLAWPLDHVFVSEHFLLKDMRVLHDVGSDHRAIVSDLCLDRKRARALNDTPEGADSGDGEDARDIAKDYVEDRQEKAAGN